MTFSYDLLQGHVPMTFSYDSNFFLKETIFCVSGVLGGNYVRDHAKMIAAVSCSKVPKISVVIGNSIGPTNTLMVCIYFVLITAVLTLYR